MESGPHKYDVLDCLHALLCNADENKDESLVLMVKHMKPHAACHINLILIKSCSRPLQFTHIPHCGRHISKHSDPCRLGSRIWLKSPVLSDEAQCKGVQPCTTITVFEHKTELQCINSSYHHVS